MNQLTDHQMEFHSLWEKLKSHNENHSKENFLFFEIAKACWWFLMFKLTDFLETIILVCGKRYELITRYHIAHHFLMPRWIICIFFSSTCLLIKFRFSMIWGAVKFVPGKFVRPWWRNSQLLDLTLITFALRTQIRSNSYP